MPKNYFLNKRLRTINGISVNTVETEISSPFNILSVEVGTTGKCGGNSKRGSRLYLKISDASNSNISIVKEGTGKGFILKAEGDCEITTLIEALDFCSMQLKKQCSDFEKKSKKNINHSSDSLATLKQVNLIKFLATKKNLSFNEKQPISGKLANSAITFLQSADEKIPEDLTKLLYRKEI